MVVLIMLIIGALDEIVYKDKYVTFTFKVLECLGNDRYLVLYDGYNRYRAGLTAIEIIYPDSTSYRII
jgi:hypothetical protein